MFQIYTLYVNSPVIYGSSYLLDGIRMIISNFLLHEIW